MDDFDKLSNFDKTMLKIVAVSITAFLVIFLVANWFRCGVQAEVYQREGIEISQWQLFVGARPAERVIRIKE